MDARESGRFCPSCGNRLARDNRGAECSPCNAKARDRFLAPPDVPADFWEAASIQSALEARHLGRVVRAYRHHPFHGSRPLPQGVVAGWFHVTQARLSRIESGPPTADLDRLSAWTRILGVPGRLLWFRLPEDRRELPRAGEAQPPRQAPTPSLPSAVRHAMLAPLAPTGLTSSDVPDVTALQAFRAADRQVGGGHLYATVTSYLQSSLAPRLFGGRAVVDGVSVFTAASGFTEMAGWMAHDAGHDDIAGQHFRRSLDLARAGDDTHLSAHIYASLSHLSLHLDEPGEAISFARRGHRALVDTPPMPHLEARLHAMEARGLAAQDDPASCTKVLLRAEKVLERSPAEEPSPWTSPFDAASLASEAARCMQRLGQLNEAERQARRIIELRAGNHTRSRAFGQLLLVGVLIAKGKPDEACDLAGEVLNTTQALSSHRVTEQLQALRAMLEPYRRSTAVAEFLPCLEEAVHERLGLYGWLAGGATTV